MPFSTEEGGIGRTAQFTETENSKSRIPFVELAARSSFSFLQGASHPQEMVEQAHALDMPALGLCDQNGLYGTARAHARAMELGNRLLVGATLPLELPLAELQASYLTEGANRERALSQKEREQLCRQAPENTIRKRWLAERRYPEILLLAQNSIGYKNLCWLLTRAHGDLPKGECLLPALELMDHTEGLTLLLPSRPNRGASHSSIDGTPRSLLEPLHESVGSNGSLFSLMYRRLDAWDEQRKAIALSRQQRYAMPIVASGRPLYHHPNRKPLADVLHCMRLGKTLDEGCAQLPANAQAYLRGPQQMQRLFPEQPRWLENSANIASDLQFQLSDLRYHFPCKTPAGKTPDDVLAAFTWQGARRRYPQGVPASVFKQLEKELALIAQLKVAPYFLSTLEVVEIARERKILCQGRGSAANSAVCYCVGITAVDPARSNLLFERFMSAERREPPDIDVDFEHERREEVIQEIYRRHGRERAAMVSEVICFRRKSCLREVSKVFGLSTLQAEHLLKTYARRSPLEERVGEPEQAPSERVGRVLQWAGALEGFPRHLSIHVGGFVLSAQPLNEVAPVEPARKENRSVIPWDKDDLKTLGFFKIDVLALGMLTAVRKALYLVWQRGHLPASNAESQEQFDPLEVVTRIPAEDPAVYKLTAQADTVGVFQIESRAQMAMLPRLRPQAFYDLVIEVAIVRPGPIQGGMVHPYLRRRNLEEPPDCHPLLKGILHRTLGVPLFQEQVMQIAIVGAGYSGGEADELRRDMAAWKRAGRLQEHEQKLLNGFARNGIDARFGKSLFKQIQGFGEYGFPESHAASFALLVYQSAWLKAHYPAEFLCALLNSQPMGFYSPSSLVKDAQRHGVVVRTVCVLSSEQDCTLEKQAVRLGLRMVNGLSRKGIETVLRQRQRNIANNIQNSALRGATGFAEFIRELILSQGDYDALAEAGAFQRLQPARRQVLWAAKAPRPAQDAVQLDLFSYAVGKGSRQAAYNTTQVLLPPLQPIETLAFDYQRMRLSLRDHPMRYLRAMLQKKGVYTLKQLAQCFCGQHVSIAGLVLSRQRPATASGVVFMTLEDETGDANLIFYRQVFEANRSVAEHSSMLLVHGTVERQDPQACAHELAALRPKGSVAPIVHLMVRRTEALKPPTAQLNHTSRDFR